MKEEKIFDSITEVNDDFIEEARMTKLKKQTIHWTKWVAIAAVFAAAAGIGSMALLQSWYSSNGSLGSGGSGHDEGTVFMYYAGPILPLTLSEEIAGLTAKRDVKFDFSPYQIPPGSPKINVTDSYAITNTTDEDITVTGIYPFAGNLRNESEILPTIHVNGEEVSAELIIGRGGSEFVDQEESGSLYNIGLESWEDYKALLSDGRYQSEAFDKYPELNQTVTVYEFTNSIADFEVAEAPTLEISFSINPAKTTCLTYGFHGYSGDSEKNTYAYSYFVPETGSPYYGMSKYLIVIGEDISDYSINGYENGSCEKNVKMDGVSADINQYQTTLGTVLWDIVQQQYNTERDEMQYEDSGELRSIIRDEDYFGLIAELIYQYVSQSSNSVQQNGESMLEDYFSAALDKGRVFYLTFDFTLKAGESVEITADMIKNASFNYVCSHNDNIGVNGYDLMTALGSNLTFESQTASIEDNGLIEIVRQNFGFDLERNIRKVTLDMEQEHYYLEVRSPAEEK